MYCLWNGEYGEHTLEEIHMTQAQIGNMLNIQDDAYKKYIGKECGDFVCRQIEYDWGRHKQVWTVECRACGEIVQKLNGYNWSRGKTGGMLCHCRADRKKEQLAMERDQKKKEKERMNAEAQTEVGKVYGHFQVISCVGFGDGRCVVRCLNCGAERKNKGINKLREGDYPHCNCGTVNYKDDKWIGTRNGHCVFVGIEGTKARIKCDCGNERLVGPSSFFRYKMYSYCGAKDCQFTPTQSKKAYAARWNGFNYEMEVEMLLYRNGYSVKHVGKTGDFGVDLIAERSDGQKIAVQCKCNKSSVVKVNAVQEVYAGGRYYDLTKFAVVSFSGISKNAVKMARKLGVYISDGETFEYPEDLLEYEKNLIPTIKVKKNLKARKLYELNGECRTLTDWAFMLGKNETYIRQGLRKGLTFEMAIDYKPQSKKAKYIVRGMEGTIEDLCRHFKVVCSQTARERIKKGFGIEEAVLMPPKITGRPRKQKESSGQTMLEI